MKRRVASASAGTDFDGEGKKRGVLGGTRGGEQEGEEKQPFNSIDERESLGYTSPTQAIIHSVATTLVQNAIDAAISASTSTETHLTTKRESADACCEKYATNTNTTLQINTIPHVLSESANSNQNNDIQKNWPDTSSTSELLLSKDHPLPILPTPSEEKEEWVRLIMLKILRQPKCFHR